MAEKNMRAQVLRDVDESASLFFLYCYLREQRLRLSYSLHRLILYIFTYIINKVSWQIYPGIQADTRTNSSITVFVLALGFLTNEKMWIEWTSERMVNVRTFQNCFQGISGLGVYASGTSKGCGLIWHHVFQYARNSQEKRADDCRCGFDRTVPYHFSGSCMLLLVH